MAEKDSNLIDGESVDDELDQDYEALDELADELESQSEEEEKTRTKEKVEAIRQEIFDLEFFRNLAMSITENSKG